MLHSNRAERRLAPNLTSVCEKFDTSVLWRHHEFYRLLDLKSHARATSHLRRVHPCRPRPEKVSQHILKHFETLFCVALKFYKPNLQVWPPSSESPSRNRILVLSSDSPKWIASFRETEAKDTEICKSSGKDIEKTMNRLNNGKPLKKLDTIENKWKHVVDRYWKSLRMG